MRVLVTGTSSGIGGAIAVRLAEHGHEVVAGVRRLADAPAHPRIRAVELDVTDTAHRPRTRYLVAADARMVVTMKQLLPARTVDTMLSRIMGLPRRATD